VFYDILFVFGSESNSMCIQLITATKPAQCYDYFLLLNFIAMLAVYISIYIVLDMICQKQSISPFCVTTNKSLSFDTLRP